VNQDDTVFFGRRSATAQHTLPPALMTAHHQNPVFHSDSDDLMAAHASVIPANQLKIVLALDGPEFLEQAYRLMLGRPVDAEGFRNYAAQLRAGASKLSVLAALRDSEEGQAHGADIPRFSKLAERKRSVAQTPTRGFENTDSNASPVPANIVELLAFDDLEFIQSAYRTLLKRHPDPSGMLHYLQLVRSGRSKMQIVCRLWLSTERRKLATSLPGVKRAMVQYWLATSRLTSWWYRPFAMVEGETPIERRLRIIENTLMRMVRERQRESADLDASVNDIDRFLRGLATRQPPDPSENE
jgi:hypothetical protein